MKIIIRTSLFFSLSVIPLLLACHFLVERSSEGKVFTHLSAVPQHQVGLVLGCAKTLANGRYNLFFKYRIEAAVELYNTNKIKYFIVSGDNSHAGYDEPTAMKEELIKKGIPAEKIYCDYAGFRTLDSVVRAAEVFQQKNFLIISQGFHTKRAIYIANNYGLQVAGFAAREVNFYSAFKTTFREYLARTKMVIDLHILNTGPKFLGPKITIPQSA